jgi:membrane-bound acyltransferase YfiQ involved in biofilm formation
MLAIIGGRAFRFLLEGYLAIKYGSQAKAILTRYYPWIGVGLALLAIAYFVARNIIKAKKVPVVEQALEPESNVTL